MFHAVPVTLTALLGIVHFTPLIPWVTRQITVWGPKPDHGTLIVLGGEQQADGALGMMSYWRCIYAARLYKEGQFAKVLVSGGASNPRKPHAPALAAAMAEFLAGVGVPREAIMLEPLSSSTHLNAQYSAKILKDLPGPYTLVTSDFHSSRAQRCFARAGITAGAWPVPDVLKRFNTWGYRIQCGVILAEELTKTIYYRWKGWI